MAMRIRPAAPGDIPALSRLHAASWQAAYPHILPPEYLSRLNEDSFREIWEKIMENRKRTNLVADDPEHGGVVGFVGFGPARDEDLDSETIGEIHGIYLHPSVWSLGYGRALMEAALERLSADGRFEEVILWTWQENFRARRFYERAGFAPDGTEITRDRFGPPRVEVRYRRTL